jgi:WD40 repeat protein
MFENENLLKLIFTNYRLPRRSILIYVLPNHLLHSIILKIYTKMNRKSTVSFGGSLIRSVIKLPNGNLAAGGAFISILDGKHDYTCIQKLRGHTGNITSLLSFPNSDIASASTDQTIRIWRRFGEYECTKIINGFKSTANYLILQPNGFLVSGHGDRNIMVWDDKNDFKCIKIIEAHKKGITSLLSLPNGRFVSGSDDQAIKVWHEKDYKCIKVLEGHERPICSLILIDSKTFASASGKAIKIWNSTNFELLMTIRERINLFIAFALVDDFILTALDDGNMRLYSQKGNHVCNPISSEYEWRICSLVPLPADQLVFASSYGGIQVWGFE